MPAAVFSLAFAAFAIGTTEFVIVGLLPDIGRAFGISVSTAGSLVSFYALAITVGTPVASALTARLPRRALLLALMILHPVQPSGGTFDSVRGAARDPDRHGGRTRRVLRPWDNRCHGARAHAEIRQGRGDHGKRPGGRDGDRRPRRNLALRADELAAAVPGNGCHGRVDDCRPWRLLPALAGWRSAGAILSQLAFLKAKR